jgi:hypothetical protein
MEFVEHHLEIGIHGTASVLEAGEVLVVWIGIQDRRIRYQMLGYEEGVEQLGEEEEQQEGE